MKKMKRVGDYVRSGFEKEFRIITDIERYGEYPDFLYLVMPSKKILTNSDICKIPMPVDLYQAYGEFHYGIYANK